MFVKHLETEKYLISAKCSGAWFSHQKLKTSLLAFNQTKHYGYKAFVSNVLSQVVLWLAVLKMK